jgi:branched-chain amino acid transport system permease protein
MDILVQQIVSGLATGGIYASLALALVMIYQATDVVNFAQGEMAMFSTYLAWSMLQAGLPYWVTFCGTVAIAFVGGLLVERIVIRPVEGQPILTIVIVTLGLLVIFNSMAGWIYSYIQKPFPSPFPPKPIKIGNIVFGAHDLGAIGITLVVSGIQLYAFAAATVGGFTSPMGAVVGGLLVGVTENLVGTYVSFIGTELKLTVALAMIIIVLLVRPTGLFGRTTVRRV